MPQYPVSPAKTSPLPTQSKTAWEPRRHRKSEQRAPQGESADADLQLTPL
jgi:hypothetical protein